MTSRPDEAAVETELIDPNKGAEKWRIMELEDCVREALIHLRNDRRTLAIDTLKAALSGETW